MEKKKFCRSRLHHRRGRKYKKNILFSLPFFWGGGGGRENKTNFIFTPVLEKEGEYISTNDWLPGSFSYWYVGGGGGVILFYQIEK